MNKTCPSCSQPLPPDAPGGLCPQCLLIRGFRSDPNRTSDYLPFDPPSVTEIAALFPQLEVLELLGAGGMGAVYKARQPALDRFVALKILPKRDDPAFSERFTREARALAKLNHPGIVTVHDFGQAGDLYYFVMEYVEGVNLRQAEKAGKLTPAEALAIVPQICAALQFAHDAGVVHRDIKPENILLDAKGRVKIADFGLAKLSGKDTPNPLTHTHQVMGTIHYMAPEQWEKPASVDHRADIYSLGVVFYELLTGELPLGRFPLPSERVQIDVRLDDIVLRTLEKQPERRYQHASDVKTDVEKVAVPPRTPSQSVLILDRFDFVRRFIQNGLLLVAVAFVVFAIDSFRLTIGNATPMVRILPGLYFSHAQLQFGLAALAVALASLVKQRWKTTYRGHRVQFINGILSPKRLYVDGILVAGGGFGRQVKVEGRVHSGEGASDRLVAKIEAGVLHLRLRLFAESTDPPTQELPSISAQSSSQHGSDVKAGEEKASAPPPAAAPSSPVSGSRSWMTHPTTLAIIALTLGIISVFLPWAHIQIMNASLNATGFSQWYGRATLGVSVTALGVVSWLALAKSHFRAQMHVAAWAGLLMIGASVAYLPQFFATPTMEVTERSGIDAFDDAAERFARSVFANASGSLREGPLVAMLAGASALGVGALQLRRARQPQHEPTAPAEPRRPTFLVHVALPALAILVVWLIAYQFVRSDNQRTHREFQAARATDPNATIPEDSPLKDVAIAVVQGGSVVGPVVVLIFLLRWMWLRVGSTSPKRFWLTTAAIVLGLGMVSTGALFFLFLPRHDASNSEMNSKNQQLIGEWEDEDRLLIVEFRADGTLYWDESKGVGIGGIEKVADFAGQYSGSGDRIEIKAKGRPARQYQVVLKGDELTLKADDGDVKWLKRAKALPDTNQAALAKFFGNWVTTADDNRFEFKNDGTFVHWFRARENPKEVGVEKRIVGRYRWVSDEAMEFGPTDGANSETIELHFANDAQWTSKKGASLRLKIVAEGDGFVVYKANGEVAARLKRNEPEPKGNPQLLGHSWHYLHDQNTSLYFERGGRCEKTVCRRVRQLDSGEDFKPDPKLDPSKKQSIATETSAAGTIRWLIECNTVQGKYRWIDEHKIELSLGQSPPRQVEVTIKDEQLTLNYEDGQVERLKPPLISAKPAPK